MTAIHAGAATPGQHYSLGRISESATVTAAARSTGHSNMSHGPDSGKRVEHVLC